MSKVLFSKELHTYHDEAGRKYPCVSEILEHFGISDIASVRRFVGDACVDASSAFGTNVHDTCRLFDQDDLAECDPLIEPYLNGWKKYVADFQPKFVAIEQPMISKLWGFAGTPDRVADCDRFLEVPDIKTGATTVAEELQTAFYQILAEEHFAQKVNRRYSVHLTENSYKIVPHADGGDLNAAKSLITIYNYKLRRGLL